MSKTLDKVKKNINDNLPLYTYVAGVVIGGVTVRNAMKPVLLVAAGHGYALALSDVNAMIKSGANVNEYFENLEKAATALAQK